MAFKRASLKAIGLSDEQIESVMDLHTEVTDGLKQKIAELQGRADKYDEAQSKLDALEKDDFKAKYEKEHADFEKFKKDITAKESLAANEKAGRAYFEEKGITGANLDIAMRGAKEEIGALVLEDGKIKDTKSLDALLEGTFKGLRSTTTQQGTQTVTPPANGGTKLTKDQIFAIKDAGERQKAIAENHELFGF